jgi:hypothetical protein
MTGDFEWVRKSCKRNYDRENFNSLLVVEGICTG